MIDKNTTVTYNGNNRPYLADRPGKVLEFNSSHTSALVDFPRHEGRPQVSEWIGVGYLKEQKDVKFLDALSELKSQLQDTQNRIVDIDREFLKFQHERDQLFSKKTKLLAAIRALEAV